MYDVLRFWLERGVDGFRVDVMNHLIKDAQFRDNPAEPRLRTRRRLVAPPAARLQRRPAPRCRRSSSRCASVVDSFSSEGSARLLIGEIYAPIDRLMAYYGRDKAGVLQGAQLPFNFHLIGAHWQAEAIDRPGAPL